MTSRPTVTRLSLIIVGALVTLYVIRELWHLGIIVSAFQHFDPSIPFVYVRTGQPILNTRHGLVIPTKIHQLWKTKDLSTYPGAGHNASSSAWRQRYKDWTYRLWTDVDVEDLLIRDYLWLLPQYRAYAHDIQRADLARLVILHHEGGVYVDLDGHPWDATIDCCPEMLTYDAVLTLTSNRLVTNHFLMARKHSAFLGYCLHHSHRTILHLWWLHYLDVFYSTGPLFLYQMLREYAAATDASQLAATAGAVAYITTPTAATAETDAATGDVPSSTSPPATTIGIGNRTISPLAVAPQQPQHHQQQQPRIRESILILNPENANAFVNHRGGRSWMSSFERAVNWVVDRGPMGVLLVGGVVITVGALVAAVAVQFLAAARKAKSSEDGHRRPASRD